MTIPPTIVTEKDFRETETVLKYFYNAQREGIAIVFTLTSMDEQFPEGAISANPRGKVNIGPLLAERKRLSRTGRCLYFDAGDQCTAIIDAHSIQRKGALSLIAQDGHVYAISTNHGEVVKSRGKVVFTKQGIKNVSTFRGFCQRHDGQIFSPIDTQPMIPTTEQAFLYAYRSLCKELFIKENALSLSGKMMDEFKKKPALFEMIEVYRRGTIVGTEGLRNHKALYDESLMSRSFEDISFELYVSEQKPTVVFSGQLYPDFDFCGRPLQDLGDDQTPLDLIAFSFAPMQDNQWGILFAWHISSERTCVPLMNSLTTRIKKGADLGDCLFRLVIEGCENLAFSPAWWESLSEEVKDHVVDSASKKADLHVATRPNYLENGLEGISGWEFSEVITEQQAQRS